MIRTRSEIVTNGQAVRAHGLMDTAAGVPVPGGRIAALVRKTLKPSIDRYSIAW